MTTAAIVIPFRDRGIDPLRMANLHRVLDWWNASPWTVTIVGDGRGGDEQFNRSAAYNIGAELTDANVIVYTEADMLLPYEQVEAAISIASSRPGLVVPFTEYRYLSGSASRSVREGMAPEEFTPQWSKRNGTSIGAVNVVSRETLSAVGGYTELTEGNWFDDNIMHRAFEVCAGKTHWVSGPAFHLYHLPGWKGDHLTDEDKAATARNKALWEHVQTIDDPARMRAALRG